MYKDILSFFVFIFFVSDLSASSLEDFDGTRLMVTSSSSAPPQNKRKREMEDEGNQESLGEDAFVVKRVKEKDLAFYGFVNFLSQPSSSTLGRVEGMLPMATISSSRQLKNKPKEKVEDGGEKDTFVVKHVKEKEAGKDSRLNTLCHLDCDSAYDVAEYLGGVDGVRFCIAYKTYGDSSYLKEKYQEMVAFFKNPENRKFIGLLSPQMLDFKSKEKGANLCNFIRLDPQFRNELVGHAGLNKNSYRWFDPIIYMTPKISTCFMYRFFKRIWQLETKENILKAKSENSLTIDGVKYLDKEYSPSLFVKNKKEKAGFVRIIKPYKDLFVKGGYSSQTSKRRKFWCPYTLETLSYCTPEEIQGYGNLFLKYAHLIQGDSLSNLKDYDSQAWCSIIWATWGKNLTFEQLDGRMACALKYVGLDVQGPFYGDVDNKYRNLMGYWNSNRLLGVLMNQTVSEIQQKAAFFLKYPVLSMEKVFDWSGDGGIDEDLINGVLGLCPKKLQVFADLFTYVADDLVFMGHMYINVVPLFSNNELWKLRIFSQFVKSNGHFFIDEDGWFKYELATQLLKLGGANVSEWQKNVVHYLSNSLFVEEE